MKKHIIFEETDWDTLNNFDNYVREIKDILIDVHRDTDEIQIVRKVIDSLLDLRVLFRSYANSDEQSFRPPSVTNNYIM